MSRRASSTKVGKQPTERYVLADGAVVFSTYPKRVEDAPLEYQAAVYAKNQREQYVKQAAKVSAQLNGLRSDLKVLNLKLRDVPIGTALTDLEKEIKAKEKSIRKAPKPKRKWSPLLTGSFEAGKR